MTVKEFREQLLEKFEKDILYKECNNMECEEDFQRLIVSLDKMIDILNRKVDLYLSHCNICEEYCDLSDINITDSQQNSTENQKGFVYIAKQTNEDGIYKIGVSKDIESRKKSFKTGNAYIEMIASLESGIYKKIEKAIHASYRKNRFSGEWFKLSNEELELIIETFGFNLHLSDTKEIK